MTTTKKRFDSGQANSLCSCQTMRVLSDLRADLLHFIRVGTLNLNWHPLIRYVNLFKDSGVKLNLISNRI